MFVSWVGFLSSPLAPVTVRDSSLSTAAVWRAGGVVTVAGGSCGTVVKSVVVMNTVVVMT